MNIWEKTSRRFRGLRCTILGRRRLFSSAIFALTTAFVVGASASETEDPSETILDLHQPVLIDYLSHLVREGGMGRFSRERAAFLVVDRENGWQCLQWPPTSAFQSETYVGRVPAGSIAIAHTHPRSEPYPSRGDRTEAVRLQMPIVVLTPRAIHVVLPDGSVRAVERNRHWMQPPSDNRCHR